MEWRASVDIYCERMDPSFWAEPLNAISNAAFIIAALVAAGTARTSKVTNPAIWLLIVLAALIGTGSFLFHTSPRSGPALPTPYRSGASWRSTPSQAQFSSGRSAGSRSSLASLP